jgi:hypothetical protein
MLMLLVLCALVAACMAAVLPRWDGRLAWALGTVLALLAGFRGGGFDYEEYLTIIDLVRSVDDGDWLAKLFFAKDPLFLVIIELAGWFSHGPDLVFVIVAAVSVGTKVLASSALPGRRTAFVALYAVLLAPGLEFAAIRSGLALGLLMLALVSVSRWRSGWAVAAVLAHSSALLAWMGRLFSTHRRTVLLLGAAGLPFAAPLVLEFAQDDPRYQSYLANPGTVAAFMLPTFTLLLMLTIQLAARRAPAQGYLHPSVLSASWMCTLLALALALPVVTASFRTMELAWVLLLAQWLALSRVRDRIGALTLLAGALFIGILCLTNVLRDVWLMMVPLPR